MYKQQEKEKKRIAYEKREKAIIGSWKKEKNFRKVLNQNKEEKVMVLKNLPMSYFTNNF